jgi:hypothetical protein
LALEGKTVSRWLPALRPLTQLTSLDIMSVVGELDDYIEHLQDLPASLVRLQLPRVVLGGRDPPQQAAAQLQQTNDCLDFSHLTRLSRLQLAVIDVEVGHFSAQMPAQLLELDAGCHHRGVVPLLGVTALQQLQRLMLPACKEQRTDLLQLTALSALTHLELTSTFTRAQEMAGAWAQLPQCSSVSGG